MNLRKRGGNMSLSFGEKLQIILKRKHMSMTSFAELMGTSRQNISNKLKRNNFSELEMMDICKKLNCTYDLSIVMNDTKETV